MFLFSFLFFPIVVPFFFGVFFNGFSNLFVLITIVYEYFHEVVEFLFCVVFIDNWDGPSHSRVIDYADFLGRLAVRLSMKIYLCWISMVLRREIPMAWGTTTDSLTPEINHFQYAIEIKYLILKDQTLYLISDSWSRSPLTFPNPACIDRLLSQQSVNKASILYI